MALGQVILKELRFHAVGSVLAVLAIGVGIATVRGGDLFLARYDRRERALLAEQERLARMRMDRIRQLIRQATDRLGFNLAILPADQPLSDWYAKDYATRVLPPDAVNRLREPPPKTFEKAVAQLRQKIRWHERNWTVIVVGTEGRILRQTTNGVVESIELGTVWLGHEIHRGMGLTVGESVTLCGQNFRVARCLEPEGSSDDITIWMSLSDAQALLHRPNAVNEIVAVKTRGAADRPDAVRREIETRLTGVRVIEQVSKSMTQLHARLHAAEQAERVFARENETRLRLASERRWMAWGVKGVVLVFCAIWTGLLALSNAIDRRIEIGIWLTLGWDVWQMVRLVGGKWCILGMSGAVVGFTAGTLMPEFLEPSAIGSARSGWSNLGDPRGWLLAFALGLGLTLVASWLALGYLVRQDPAVILRHE